MDKNFINHTAIPGSDNGPYGMLNTFKKLIRPAFSDLKVHIHDQIAEGNKVTTRKTISGIHTGTFMGIAPTGKIINIEIIDIVTIVEGKYLEHWGINTLSQVIAELSKST